MCNKEIRAIMKREKIFIWQIAEKLSVHETTMIKRLRTELSEKRKGEVLSAVEEIKLDRLKGQR